MVPGLTPLRPGAKGWGAGQKLGGNSMRIPETSPKHKGNAPHTAAKALTSTLEAPIAVLKAFTKRLLMDRSTITTPRDGQAALPNKYEVHRSCCSSKGLDADFRFPKALGR
jgi:hypothetical protein